MGAHNMGDIFYDQFEQDGEAAVRDNLAHNRYQTVTRVLAQKWIDGKDQEREEASKRSRDAQMAEDRRIARSAKNAAWAAAIAAMIAAISAVIAIFLKK